MCVDSKVLLLTFHHLWFEWRVPDLQHAFVVVAVAELVLLTPTDETCRHRGPTCFEMKAICCESEFSIHGHVQHKHFRPTCGTLELETQEIVMAQLPPWWTLRSRIVARDEIEVAARSNAASHDNLLATWRQSFSRQPWMEPSKSRRTNPNGHDLKIVHAPHAES